MTPVPRQQTASVFERQTPTIQRFGFHAFQNKVMLCLYHPLRGLWSKRPPRERFCSQVGIRAKKSLILKLIFKNLSLWDNIYYSILHCQLNISMMLSKQTILRTDALTFTNPLTITAKKRDLFNVLCSVFENTFPNTTATPHLSF